MFGAGAVIFLAKTHKATDKLSTSAGLAVLLVNWLAVVVMLEVKFTPDLQYHNEEKRLTNPIKAVRWRIHENL